MSSSEKTFGSYTISDKGSSKRLIFDRRYGWVIDEWKHPSEEALSGARGMFCLLPLAKALVNKASESDDSLNLHVLPPLSSHINLVANSIVEVLERPGLLQPQASLQARLSDPLHKLMASLQNSDSNMFGFKKDFSLQSTVCSSQAWTKSGESDND